MDFELSESQRILRNAVRAFVRTEIAPHAAEWDEAERFPTELMPKLGKMGLLGVRVPEQYGGSGMDMVSYVICVEELARADGATALTVASHNGLGTGHVLAFGTEEQKRKYLPRAASGEALAAWALTEPGNGSDAAAVRTTARREGDHWILNGTKAFVTQGSVAAFCVVLARTNTAAPPAKGITAFIVDCASRGFAASGHLRKLGCRASDTAELILDEVCVDDGQRLGEVDRGFIDTMQILDCGRIGIAAMAVGLGNGALGRAVGHARERRAFGKTIGEFDAVRWMLANARTELDAAALLTHRAAWLVDRGRAHTREASMAKVFASEAATRACHAAVQIFGGYGYARAFEVERYLRDAKLCEIGEGTSEVQRLVIAKQVLAS
jgi:alkylation response protein AidB-like acyl-CoA dehydrogenase